MKRGFTLIELLAVIVILAVIALIAVPIVLNVIDRSKESALLVSAENYKETLRKAILNENVGKLFKPKFCKVENSKLYCDNELIKMEIDGQKPIEGEFKLENNKIKEMFLIYSDEIVIYKNNKYKVATYETYEGDSAIDLKDVNESILYNYKIHNNVSPKLPAEYQEIEYIESTGVQWIDTGVNFRDNLRTEIKYQFTNLDTAGNSSLFGGYISADGSNGYMIALYNGKFAVRLGGKLTSISDITINTDVHTDIFRNQTGSLIHDGVEYDSEYTGYVGKSTKVSSANIPIFCHLYTGNLTRQWYSSIKLYYFKLYDNDTEQSIRDFVPCYRVSDNVAGLYDLVNNQFYENSGTESFIQGPKVEYLLGEHNEATEKYKIKISLMSDNSEYDSHTIEFDSPLKEGEYIDYKKGSIVRLDGTEEKIDLPELKITEPNTTLKIDGKGKLELEVYK